MAGQEPDTTPFTLPQNLFSFFANAPAGSALSQPAMEARRRMALQLMANAGKKGYPKNLGEGLTAIGDAIGERSAMNQLAAQEAAYQKAAAAGAEGSVPGEARAGTRTAYASPDDNAGDAPVPEAGPVATAAPMDTNATLTPAEAQGGVSKGDYNLLDAQEGMKRAGQGRVQDAVTAAYPNNPDMQAYASQLAAGEQQAPCDTSKTGARGPWQFVPGTAKQYGLTNPDDPMASAQALKAFTANNAAIFQRINGRPPTMAELAVMHQQGGQTGASMVAGTGNAPPRNLALNNVPAGAGPAQAVGAIKNYYGMPDRPVNPRDAVAQAMTMRPTAQAVPQSNPTSTGGPTMPPTSPAGISPSPSIPAPAGGPAQATPPDQRMAFAGLPPEIATGVSAAPPMPPAIQAVPKAAPQSTPPSMPQAAQATPQRLIPQEQAPLPQDEPMSDDLKRGYRRRAQGYALGDQNIIAEGQSLVDYGERQRKQSYDAKLKAWQDTEAQKNARQLAEEAFTRAQSTPQAQASKAFGGLSEETVMEPIKKSTEMVKTIPAAQTAIQNALRVAPQMFSGSTAEVNLSLQKMMASAGFPVNPKIPATEEFKSFIAPVLSAARQALVGGANISDSDMKIARQAVGGEITLDAQTIPAVLASLSRMNVAMAIEHQRKLEVVGGNSPERQAALGTYALPMENIVPREAIALLKSNPSPEMATHFNNKYHTPGLAQKILGGP